MAVGDDVDPYALADEVLVPLRVAGADGPRRGATAMGGEAATVDLPAVGSGLTVTGAEVSAVVREGDGLLVRVFNPAAKAATVTIDGRRGGLVDLRGRPLAPFEGRSSCRHTGSPPPPLPTLDNSSENCQLFLLW